MTQIITQYITKNPYFSDGRYLTGNAFYGFFLHSVGCSQPDPLVFIRGWDNPNHTNSGINGFISDQVAYVVAPCLETPGKVKRMPHACRPANDHYIGFEMCEPRELQYNSTGTKFTVPADKLQAAKNYVAATYVNAVYLFAMLCKFHNKDPLQDGVILSHKEGALRGIASSHGDPEHLWNGLGMGYTMDGFRADVKAKMEEEVDMTVNEVKALIKQEVAAAKQELASEIQTNLQEAISNLADTFQIATDNIRNTVQDAIDKAIDAALGPQIEHLDDAPKWMRTNLAELLEQGVINGGTPADEDPLDVNKRRSILEAVLMGKVYTDRYVQSFMLPVRNEVGDEDHPPDPDVPEE